MTTFVPAVWWAQAKKVNNAAENFYRGAEPVITARALTARTNSPLEAAAVWGDGRCRNPWHHLIASAYESLTSVGTKMHATGDDYQATEWAAARARFWSDW